MAAPAVLYILLWRQMVLRSRQTSQVVLSSLLAKAIGEYGMESKPRKQSSVAGYRSVPKLAFLADYTCL